MKSAFEEIEEIVEDWKAERHNVSKSLATLEKKYRQELESLQDKIRASKAAVVAAQAAEIAQKNSDKRRIEREFEAKIHEAEQASRKILKDIAAHRDRLDGIRRRLPDGITTEEKGYGSDRTDLFNESDYEELVAVARDTSLMTSLKRFMGNGSLSPSQAHSRVLGMLAHDEAILDSREHDAKRLVPLDELKRERLEEIRRIESTPSRVMAHQIDDEAYREEREMIKRRYEKAKLRIQSSACVRDLSDVVDVCRALCLDRSASLGCAPNNLTSDYENPSVVPETMFDYWTMVDIEGQKIAVPHAFCMEQPQNYLIETTSSNGEAALRAVRSMTAFQLKQMPYGMLKVYWLDTQMMGRSLGILSELAAPVSSGKKAPIDVAISRIELSKVCGELEEEMGRRSFKIAASGSAWRYNITHDSEPIPNILVIAIGVDDGHFGKDAINTLSMLAENSSALGIQIIATTGARLGQQNKEGDLGVLASECVEIHEENSGLAAIEDGENRQLLFAGENWIPKHLIDQYKQLERKGHLLDRAPLSFDVSIDEKGLRIPIGWDNSGAEVALDFSDYVHAFLAGVTGSGKSVFLHNVIVRACERYSPTELQICLVDYKKSEFGMYRDDTFCFPNIIFIGLDNTRGFVDALMKYLVEIFNERQELINSDNSRDIIRYNRTHDEKLPQLLVIMDEFHRQSALTDYSGDSARDLEFLLRESRSYGIHFLIADQEIGNLTGLSDPARKQLGGRIQLNWAESSELVNMFEVASYDIGVNKLDRGQAIIKNKGELILCEWPYVSEADIASARKTVSSKWKRVKPLLVQDSSESRQVNIACLPMTPDGIYAIGTTANFLNPYIGLPLSRRRRENVFILNKSSDISARLACSIAASHIGNRQKGRIILISPYSESFYSDNKQYWMKLKENYKAVEYFDASGICSYFDDGVRDGDFVVLFGLDAIAEEMEDADSRTVDSGSLAICESELVSIDDKIDMLLKLESGDLDDQIAVNPSSNKAVYDARLDLLSLVRSGGSRDIHICVVSDTVLNLYATFGPDSVRDDFKELFPFRITPSCEYGEAAALGIMEAGFGEGGGLSEEVYMITKSGTVEVLSPFRFED